MKQKVKFSVYSLVITGILMVIFVIGIWSQEANPDKFIPFYVVIAAVVFSGFYYCPKWIEATEREIVLHRLLSKSKVFPYGDIQSVDTFYPSAGGLKLCGSGGFFGYWGYFNDIMIGTYFGYYGSRSNCILVKLKSGRQYVLGCDNAPAMVDFINEQMGV